MPIVLVVEDDPLIADIVRGLLEAEGYQVRWAPNGQDALAQLARRRPNVILSDLQMPGVDGTTFLHTVRRTPGLGTIPVVVVSATGEVTSLEGLDVAAFLRKPFSLEHLLAIVARLAAPVSHSQ